MRNTLYFFFEKVKQFVCLLYDYAIIQLCKRSGRACEWYIEDGMDLSFAVAQRPARGARIDCTYRGLIHNVRPRMSLKIEYRCRSIWTTRTSYPLSDGRTCRLKNMPKRHIFRKRKQPLSKQCQLIRRQGHFDTYFNKPNT